MYPSRRFICRLTELAETKTARPFFIRFCVTGDGWIDLIIHGCERNVYSATRGIGIPLRGWLERPTSAVWLWRRPPVTHANALHMLASTAAAAAAFFFSSFIFFFVSPLLFHFSDFLKHRAAACPNPWRLIYESAAPLAGGAGGSLYRFAWPVWRVKFSLHWMTWLLLLFQQNWFFVHSRTGSRSFSGLFKKLNFCKLTRTDCFDRYAGG